VVSYPQRNCLHMKFAYHNSNFEKAELVLFGLPDESGSHAERKGSAKGPDSIRKASQRNVYKFSGGQAIYEPEVGSFNKKLHDFGNVNRKDLSKIFPKLGSKIPIFLGGDHSITFDILKNMKTKISVVYLDAHPDASYSKKPYYGSVISDLSVLKNIDLKSSILIGARAATDEENFSLQEFGLKTIRSQEIEERGIKHVLNEIKGIVGKNIYFSIDLDVCDPAFVPGVSTPIPGGLTSRELIFLARHVAKLGLIGFDIVEHVPKFDVQEMTAHLASNLILEIISNLP